MLAALCVVGVVFVLVSFLLVGILSFFLFLVESLILAQDERWRRA